MPRLRFLRAEQWSQLPSCVNAPNPSKSLTPIHKTEKKKMNIKSVGIVGTGVIGASWAAFFLARGFDVRATDPAPGAEQKLRELIASYWPTLRELGMAESASQKRLLFEKDIQRALEGVDFVQENGPERLDIKRDLIATIDAAIAEDVIIATSSSGILISSIQDAAKHPERVLLGHPFSPPHLIPLVEVLGGKLTSEEYIKEAISFYSRVGKKPIRIRREIKGHVTNRLQAALWQEAFWLVEQGIATVADIDTAISYAVFCLKKKKKGRHEQALS